MFQAFLFGKVPFTDPLVGPRQGARAQKVTHGPAVEKGTGLWRQGVAAVMLAGFVAACASSPTPEPQPRRPYTPQNPSRLTLPEDDGWREQPGYVQPRHMQGTRPTRIAILLPFSADDPGVQRAANGLRDAAQLGLFEVRRDELVLIPKDTRGTPEGAAVAAQEALAEGAELIIGPLFAGSVSAVGQIAQPRGVPVVGFSTDRQIAQPGVYLLSFQVEEEVSRVVGFAASQELTTFAALVPRNPYGERIRGSLEQLVLENNGNLRHMIAYDPLADDFRSQVRQLAEYASRRSALEQQRRALSVREDSASRRALQRLQDAETWGPVSFQAVMLPAGGTTLRNLAATLPYYDIDNRTVRFLGTGLWDDPSLWKEQALQGGWFAAPPPEARTDFERLFQETFGYMPPRIASLGYDAVTLAAALSDGPAGERFNRQRLTNPNGFAGIDGIFRFRSDGSAERGLAVLEIRDGSVTVVGPAPTQFDINPNPFWGDPGT